ncbi:protein PELPK1-like [Cynara cardunculus var. scolymus]|uniref:Uncharacterized protein n=1 Tax=Cynara cardunculus var. scolymus TaxID=59895 RepID=A0A118JX07_CYNCS|nr:protein PELPK1-like [Cynara cardunculus var. scolymus]KVH96249.1 hypothetical protein Ccrd_001657 [Cynara cardunculus var. scolymus]
MSSFTFKMMAGSLPPVTGSNAKGPAAASVKRPTIPLQVRVKELQKLESSEKTSVNVSRRDLALCLTAASIGAATLSLPQPAEARVSRIEIKKMILEKFKMLREKVGLSKPETEETEKQPSQETEETENQKPAPPPKAEQEIPAPPVPSLPKLPEIPVPPVPSLPKLHNDQMKHVVEAPTLP